MRWVVGGSSVVAVAIALLPVYDALADPAATTANPEPPNAVVPRVLDLTNAERGKMGLPPLTLSAELTLAAQAYSQVLASGNCFEHTCGPVPNFADRDVAAGYLGWTTLGENLAGGFSTPEAVVAGWMASPSHRANILSLSYTDVGIGVTSGNSRFGMCWAEEFGSRYDGADDD
jgi:uncharacterized protein YkwD